MIDEMLYPCTFTVPTARVNHKCGECYGVINAGEKYNLIKGLSDGRWGTYKICADCHDLIARVNKSHDPSGHNLEEHVCLGGLSEDICEYEPGHPFILEYIKIREKRGVPIHETWRRISIARPPIITEFSDHPDTPF